MSGSESDALLAIFRKALEDIASYGHDGICPYGCDTPNIAREALKHKMEETPQFKRGYNAHELYRDQSGNLVPYPFANTK